MSKTLGPLDQAPPAWYWHKPSVGTFFRHTHRRCGHAWHRQHGTRYPLQLRSAGHARLAAGNSFGSHAWPYLFLLWSIDEGGFMELDNRHHELSAHTVCVVQAGMRHRFGARTKTWSYRWLTIDGPMASHGMELSATGIHQQGRCPDHLFKRATDALRKDSDAGNHLGSVLAYDIYCTAMNSSALDASSLVEQCLRLIDERFADSSFGISQLAEDLGVHRSYLSECIKRSLGQSPLQLLHNRRLEEAMRMLGERQNNINLIARACGFNSSDGFRRFIRRHLAATPRELQQQLTGISARR